MVTLNITGLEQDQSRIENREGLPDYAGGHENETHVDAGALKFLRDKFDVKSMIDVGCGPAGMYETAADLGISWVGVDVDFNVLRPENAPVVIHDYQVAAFDPVVQYDREWNAESQDQFAPPEYDLAWTVEFLEHIEPRYIQNFMTTLQRAKYVICTHAFPDQPGHHHVNCRDHAYWIDIFTAFGFEVDVETTNQVREASTMEARYMRQQSLFFKNLNL